MENSVRSAAAVPGRKASSGSRADADAKQQIRDFLGDRGIKHLELMVDSRVVKSLIKRVDLRLLPLKALGERGTCT